MFEQRLPAAHRKSRPSGGGGEEVARRLRQRLPGVAKGEVNPRLPGEQVTPQGGVFVGDDGDRVRLPGRERVERQSVEEPPEVAQHFRRRMRRAVRSEEAVFQPRFLPVVGGDRLLLLMFQRIERSEAASTG